jgi:hypothetical protein
VAAVRRGTLAIAAPSPMRMPIRSSAAATGRAIEEAGLVDASTGLDRRRRVPELLEGKELPGVAAIPAAWIKPC